MRGFESKSRNTHYNKEWSAAHSPHNIGRSCASRII